MITVGHLSLIVHTEEGTEAFRGILEKLFNVAMQLEKASSWERRSWPIYERHGGGRVMYYMIHATDHPEAPNLMNRAYHKAVMPIKTAEQMALF